jgi:hypothetical protein
VNFGDRNAPEPDRVPGRSGYSSGNRDGDVLIEETNNLVEQLDQRTTSHYDTATCPDAGMRLSVALEIVGAHGFAEIAPVVAAAPVLGQSQLAHDGLEARVGAHVALERQPRRGD